MSLATSTGKTLPANLKTLQEAKKLGEKTSKNESHKKVLPDSELQFVNADHPLATAFLRCMQSPSEANGYSLIVSTMDQVEQLPVHYTVSVSCVVRVSENVPVCMCCLLRVLPVTLITVDMHFPVHPTCESTQEQQCFAQRLG